MKRYFSLLNLVGITAALFFGVQLFYLWVTQNLHVVSAATVNTEARPDTRNVPPPPSTYKGIIRRNLFQAKASSDAAVSPNAASSTVPGTPALNLRLWGTATFASGKGFAVIEEVPANRQVLYTAGQTIQNATIQQILRDQVVLSLNGKEQVIKMEDPKSLPGRIEPMPPSPPQSASKQITLSRSQIDDAIRNVHELMTQIKIRPHFLDGKPEGLAVGGILPNSIFSRMGLRNGDIITGVNGEKILTVDDALTLYESIKSGSRVNVEVKRRGKIESLVYQIQ